LAAGWALLTGLTAQKDNAAALVRLIRRRLGALHSQVVPVSFYGLNEQGDSP